MSSPSFRPECSTEHPDPRRPHVLNADNKDFESAVDIHGRVYGELDELNGEGARETPFRPTRHELIQLVKYWAREIVALDWRIFVMAAATWEIDREQWWLAAFAERRIQRARDLLGEEIVQRASAEAHDEFRKGLMTLRQWDMFMNGTAAERVQLYYELYRPGSIEDGEAREFQEVEERNQWAEQHQAERSAEPDQRGRREALLDEDEIWRLDGESQNLE